MNSIIIYPNDNGSIAMGYPCECGLTIEQIARKDVPTGKPFLIVPDDQVPKDHTFFEAFEADFTNPHGYGIGAQAWFIEQYEAEIATINAEQAPAAPQTLVAASIDEAELPEELTPEEREAAYAELVAFVTGTNEQNAAAHSEAVAQWEASKAARIAQLNTQIAVQQQEIAA